MVGSSTGTLQLQWRFACVNGLPSLGEGGASGVAAPDSRVQGAANDKNIDLLCGTYFKLQTNKRKLSK